MPTNFITKIRMSSRLMKFNFKFPANNGMKSESWIWHGVSKACQDLLFVWTELYRLLSNPYTWIPSSKPWKSCSRNCLFLYLLSESFVLIQKYLTPWVLETPWKQHFWLIFPSLYKRDNKDSDCYCSFFVFLWDFHKIVFLLVLSSNRE